MQLTHRQLLYEIHIVAPTLFRLSAYAYHTIHTDERMRHHALDMRYAFREQLPCITPAHDLQHLVATALERNMKMRCEMFAIRYKINDLIAQQVRLTATNPYPII